MRPGQVVADRFEIERLASSGGMADVFSAFDRLSRSRVALKVLHGAEGSEFAREAAILVDISHPRIVRYVAHGFTAAGQAYVALEWLEGLDLSERLARGALDVPDSCRLARCVAEALAAAHSRGIVHRDVKPSNLFLPDGRIERVKLLDFGIARAKRAVTLGGVTIGTPGYMAPEQARSAHGVDARADVFALGCVLFECLTGARAFDSDDAMSLLVRVLVQEAPRVRDLHPDIPPEIDELVARMLAKDPDLRPRDGGAAAAEIAAIEPLAARAGSHPLTPRPQLTDAEQRLFSIVMTGPLETSRELLDALAAAAGAHDATAEPLANGALLVTLAGTQAATDLARRAAMCALAVRALVGDGPVALATGRAVVVDRAPVGEVIDRVVRLLRAARKAESTLVTDEPRPSRPRPAAPAQAVVRVDEVTAGLLDPRFDVVGDQEGLALRGVRDTDIPVRTLLAMPTPCVGRDPELASLDAILAACIAEPAARLVLVTGPPGIGKSRLAAELLRRAAERAPAPLVLMGRADSIGAGAPFGLIGRAVRRSAGVLDGEQPPLQQSKLRARVQRNLPAGEAARVTEFLGELVGVSFVDGESAQLRAARHDARLLGDQMLRAWEDWLAAECAAQPVLLVLDDLQWGDLPSVQYVGAAVKRLADAPLLVLALARHEVSEAFPGLWAGLPVQTIQLTELSARASEKLVRHVLGPSLAPGAVARIVERAGGNAFFLEELIRAVAEGGKDALPDTVLAMAQARFDALEPEARRVLRAASVLGDVFWRGAVGTLLGEGETEDASVDSWLDELARREVITPHATAKFPDAREFAFRHALVREAAAASLTAADASRGHQLAGEWLEGQGESDAALLAEHFERGGEPERAVRWYLRAAQQALGGEDLQAVMARAERGIACGARGEELGIFRKLQAEVHHWRGEFVQAEERLAEAVDRCAVGSAAWFEAAGALMIDCGRFGHHDRLIELGRTIVDQLGRGPPAAAIVAAARSVGPLLVSGQPDMADLLLDRLRALEEHAQGDPSLQARLHQVHGNRALFAGDIGASVELMGAAVEQFEAAGDLRCACVQRVNFGFVCAEIGAYAEAEAALRRSAADAHRLGLHYMAVSSKHNLGLVLGRLGRLDEARALELESIELLGTQGDARVGGISRNYLAMILLQAGDLDAAEHQARTAVAMLAHAPPSRAYALATLGRILLRSAGHQAALAAATEAMDLLHSLGGIEEGEVPVRLVHAEALRAAGREADARRAITEARDRLTERAELISDPRWRDSFLHAVPENARTLELARQWAD